MKKTKFILLLLPLVLLAQSCNLFGGGRVAGGVIKSVDSGENWQRMQKISEEATLGNISVTDLILDPDTPEKIFIAGTTRGLYKSDNAAETWQNVLAGAEIVTVRLNPRNSDIVIAGGRSGGLAKLFISKDGGSSWVETYSESRSGSYVSAITFDSESADDVFLGLSSGEIIKSANSGVSWNLVSVLKGRIMDLEISGGRMYALSQQEGLYSSLNRGSSWALLTEGIDTNTFLDFQNVDTDRSALYLATTEGLYRSGNTGSSWQRLSLPLHQNSNIVSAVTLNQENPNEVFAAISSTLYKSSDAGTTWQTRSLGVGASLRKIVVDPSQPNVVYAALGAALP